MSRILAILLFAVMPIHSVLAVEPASGRSIQMHLLSLVISTGQQQHRVSNGEILPILRGDRFRIESAQLVGQGLKPDRIDLVGFARPNQPNDDRGVWIDSATELLSRFAVVPGGDKYSVKVYRRGILAGEAFVQIVQPSLNYAEVSVNGSIRLLRADDVLKVSSKDQFKLEKVVTNLGETEDVSVRLEPIELRNSKPPYKLYEMQLIRKNVVFARLGLQVREE
jgi:hypothetical protein